MKQFLLKTWLTMLCLLMGVGYGFAAVTPLSLPKTWGDSDGQSAYTTDLGCTLSGLGSDYSSAPKLKFDTQGDYMIIQVADAPDKISFNIKGNSVSGTYSFKVQESSDGTSYTDALNITSVTSSSAKQTATLKPSTRFIKLIYTTKANGNMGIGGISITKYTPVNPYTVSFNVGSNGSFSNGETFTNGNQRTEATAGAGVTLPSVTPNDASAYTFYGWSATDGGTTKVTVDANNLYHPSADCTLYAIYKEIPVAPTFSAVAGAVEKGTTVNFTSTTEGCTFRYTTDGTNPTATTGTQASSYVVNDAADLKVVAVKDGIASAVSSVSYTVATHTITFNVNGSTTSAQAANGDAIPFPANPEANDVEFVGWTKNAIDGTADNAPSDISTSATMGTEDVTYYAVFAEVAVGNTFTQITAANALEAGGRYLIVGYSSSTYKALPVDKAETLTTVTPSSSKITNPAEELIWTLEGTTGAWKIKNVSNDKYLQISGGELTFVSSTSLTFNASVSSSKFTFTSSATSGNKILSYYANGSKFNAYTSANNVYLYKASVDYSDYCTTVKAVTGVAVKTAPTTVAYCEGEKFNPEGLEVTLTYEDETTKAVTYSDATASKFTFAPALDAALATTDDNVQITINGQSCNQAISVRSVSISAPVVAEGTYTVKVGDAEAVTADGNTINALKGQKIVLASTPDAGYKLASTPFVVKDEDNANVSVSTAGGQYSFTMPGKNVTITAQFTPVYTITAGSCEHGSITSIKDKDDATITETSKGSKVVVEATADTHYYLTGMYYVKEGEETQNTINENEGVYSFTMPQSNITVYATFAEDEKVTITWSINGNTGRTSEVYVGEAITFPTDVENVEGKVFRGWVGETDKDYTNATDAPTYANAGTVNATTAAAYYAVFATAIPGEDEEKTSTLTLNNGNVTSPYSNQDVTWNFSGLTFCNSNQPTSGMSNGASVSFTLPENAKAETFTITSTSNSWSTSNISLSLKYGETQITSFNNAGTYDFTESNNDKGAYSLTASNQSSKVAYIKTLSIKYLVPGTSYSDYCTTVKTTPTLSFAAPTYSVTLMEAFEAPELNNPQDVTVTYSSSETGVATVNSETGAITLVGAGTTTITATFEGNASYLATSASYELVVAPATATITIASACNDGETCYSTYSNTSAFVVPEGLTVSTVGVDGKGKLVVNSYNEGDVVAANTGVMVSGAAGDHNVTLTNAAATDAPGTNNLHPSSEEMTGDNLFYRLTMHNGTQIGFWWGAADGAAFNLAANKAYLAVPTSVAANSNLRLWFGDETITGIEAIETADDSAIFNLQGQRMNRIQKGVNIINGKKVLR